MLTVQTAPTRRPSVIHSHPEVMHGSPVFVGTRVPIQNLTDYLAEGYGLDEFLDDFPTVTKEQAVAAIDEARFLLERRANSARRTRAANARARSVQFRSQRSRR